MHHQRPAALFIVLGMAALVSAIFCCAASARNDVIWPTKAWDTSLPEPQGMDSHALADLVNFGATEKMESLLVTRHGRIVTEAYYAPFRAGHKHRINSATKAVTATLIAIALKNGLLDGLDRRVLDFFPDRTIVNSDDRKQAITIQHLLNQTSGLEWREPLTATVPVSYIAMQRSPDWSKFVLDQPMARSPGASFDYNSGNSHLLSAIVAKLTGGRPLDYANEQLFGPLGITDYVWPQDPQGIPSGGAGLYLLPQDMAKIGYLYLRNGAWEDRQILPETWIDAVNHATVDMQLGFMPSLRYANQFWAVPDRQVTMAVGFNRQIIVVMPALDVVVVATGTRHYSFAKLIDLITAAVRSSQPLPENAAAQSVLARSIAAAATERPSPVGPTPATAKQISGKTWQFAPNTLNVRSLTLKLSDGDASFEFINTGNRNSGPIGLDGTYRIGGQARFGVNAAKGSWQDEKTFVLDLQTLGNNDARSFTLTFEGTNVEMLFQNAVGFTARLKGTAENP
jgi:CubicO group peptidase (beta-lactamase class C family)